MCGRFILTADPGMLKETYPWLEVSGEFNPRYNVAPTQPVATVPNNGQNRLDFFIWGLVPSWAKDFSIGNRLINARAETLAEKPSFRAAYRRRRCLILADGFYEWRRETTSKGKTPFLFRMKGDNPFAFAGLWEVWNSKDGSEIYTCTIITTEANELVGQIHNRMPVILHPDSHALWLDPGEKSPLELNDLLKPFPSDKMRAYPVSKLVNNPKNDELACIQPVEEF